MVSVHNFTLTIEICICMDLDGCIRVNVLQEPFELSGRSQVIVLLGDTVYQKGF